MTTMQISSDFVMPTAREVIIGQPKTHSSQITQSAR